MNSEIMFYLLSGMIVVFSILTVTSRRILRSAVYLLFVLVSTAGLYFMLNYNFLAAVQLTVYAGGIVVLIIFSILLTSHISEKRSDGRQVTETDVGARSSCRSNAYADYDTEVCFIPCNVSQLNLHLM